MPRYQTAFAAALIMLGGTLGPASAGELFGRSALEPETLAEQRGGTLTDQTNISASTGANDDTTIVNEGDGATFKTGYIGPASVKDNSGVVTLMQNSGNVVNMNHTLNVNVHLQ